MAGSTSERQRRRAAADADEAMRMLVELCEALRDRTSPRRPVEPASVWSPEYDSLVGRGAGQLPLDYRRPQTPLRFGRQQR